MAHANKSAYLKLEIGNGWNTRPNSLGLAEVIWLTDEEYDEVSGEGMACYGTDGDNNYDVYHIPVSDICPRIKIDEVV